MPWIKKAEKKKGLEQKKGVERKLRQSFYQSKQWKTIRLSKLSETPLCEKCKSKGIIKEATEVHHLESPFDYSDNIINWDKAIDLNNLQCLCKECHSEEHLVHYRKDKSGKIIYF